MQKAIKMAQRALKHSIDDAECLETANHKRRHPSFGAGCKYTSPDVRISIYEWFKNIRGNLKGLLPRSLFKSKCQSVAKLG